MAFLGVKTQVSNSLLKENVFAFTTNGGDNNYGLQEGQAWFYQPGDEKPNEYINVYAHYYGGSQITYECGSKGAAKSGVSGSCWE